MTYWNPEGYHQLGKGEYAGISTADVLRRMREATGSATLEELTAWLGVRQSMLSDANRRNIIPIQWLRQLVLKKVRYHPLWVLTGRGDKYW